MNNINLRCPGLVTYKIERLHGPVDLVHDVLRLALRPDPQVPLGALDAVLPEDLPGRGLDGPGASHGRHNGSGLFGRERGGKQS